MRFKCNSTTSTSNTSHNVNTNDRICTLEAVDSYSTSITSGVVNMSMDITNGALATKIYYCPICKEKLLWNKKYEKDGNKLSAGAVGTFTMINDNDEEEFTITGQYGIDREEDDVEEELPQDDLETLPEYGQSRYRYNRTKWISTTETEDQKNNISWEDPVSGYIYYGTKAMNNIERGIYEANRKFTFRELQTKNLANALMKLRMNKETSFAIWGDSILAGFWYLEGEGYDGMYEPDKFTDDYGMEYKGYDRCKTRIPETMVKTLNKVYGAKKITMSRLVWNGVTVSNNKTVEGKPVDYSIFSHWKASKKDIAIMNFGINDSIGNHLPTNYMGNVSAFINGYKALIERELENGTAVVVISPFRLSTIGIEKDMKADVDDRTIIDVYEQSLYSLCQEYGVPFIDGSIMLKNFNNTMYLDLSHLMPIGNEAIGKRLASIFIGQNPLRPLKVNHNSYLSVMHQYSNCKLTGTANFGYSETSPNINTGVSIDMKFPKPEAPQEQPEGSAPEAPAPEQNESESGSVITRTAAPAPQGKPIVTVDKPKGAIQCVLKKHKDSIIWSFYAEHDGLVAIPSFENASSKFKVKMELDFGAKQGSWANYWNYVNSTEEIDRDYEEPSSVEYGQDDLKANKFGYHMLDNEYDKAIKIVSEGWHTIKLEMFDPNIEDSDEEEESIDQEDTNNEDNEAGQKEDTEQGEDTGEDTEQEEDNVGEEEEASKREATQEEEQEEVINPVDTVKVYGLTFMDIKEFEKATKAN